MLVPGGEVDVLEWAAAVNDENLVICFLRDVKVLSTQSHTHAYMWYKLNICST